MCTRILGLIDCFAEVCDFCGLGTCSASEDIVDTGLYMYTQGPHFTFEDGRGTGEREEKMDVSQTKGVKVCVSTQEGIVERHIVLDH